MPIFKLGILIIMNESNSQKELVEKLHSETAQISWSELQRFFAQGLVVFVDESLDIIEVAVCFTNDNSQKIKQMMDDKKIMKATDELAKKWVNQDAVLWSVVVQPFILVQESN